jgi:hypothetical protein
LIAPAAFEPIISRTSLTVKVWHKVANLRASELCRELSGTEVALRSGASSLSKAQFQNTNVTDSLRNWFFRDEKVIPYVQKSNLFWALIFFWYSRLAVLVQERRRARESHLTYDRDLDPGIFAFTLKSKNYCCYHYYYLFSFSSCIVKSICSSFVTATQA